MAVAEVEEEAGEDFKLHVQNKSTLNKIIALNKIHKALRYT